MCVVHVTRVGLAWGARLRNCVGWCASGLTARCSVEVVRMPSARARRGVQWCAVKCSSEQYDSDNASFPDPQKSMPSDISKFSQVSGKQAAAHCWAVWCPPSCLPPVPRRTTGHRMKKPDHAIVHFCMFIEATARSKRKIRFSWSVAAAGKQNRNAEQRFNCHM